MFLNSSKQFSSHTLHIKWPSVMREFGRALKQCTMYTWMTPRNRSRSDKMEGKTTEEHERTLKYGLIPSGKLLIPFLFPHYKSRKHSAEVREASSDFLS